MTSSHPGYASGMRRISRTALVLVLASACSLDQGGAAAPDGAVLDESAALFDAGDFADAGVDDAPPPEDGPVVAPDAAPDAAPDGGVFPTCLGILGSQSSAADGTYKVDPLGSGAFPVLCDMKSGGWTLVGRERVSGTGQFRFLDVDTSNDAALAAGSASGLIGKRFVGKYTSVRINWGTSILTFTKAPSFDLFANTVDLAVPLTGFSSTEATFNGWISGAGGAVLCVASRDNDVRPGDTSWAVTAKDDTNRGCGCNSGNWTGRGAYYGGTSGNPTVCNGHGGGWAGVKDNGVAKGDTVPTYETRIWVR